MAGQIAAQTAPKGSGLDETLRTHQCGASEFAVAVTAAHAHRVPAVAGTTGVTATLELDRPELPARQPEPWAVPRPEKRTTTAAPAAAVVGPSTGTDHPDEVKTKAQQPVDAFAALKERAATALFERMGSRFNDSAVTEQELRTSAREELTRIIDAEQVPLSADERTRLVQDVADDVLGYGPLQRLLDDPAVTEIMVNRMDQIYVERKGHLTLADSRFSSEDASAKGDRAHRVQGGAAH